MTRLDRYMPFVDVPLLLHRAPALLEMDTEQLVRRVARMKVSTLRGGDVGRLLSLAPSLLLATEADMVGTLFAHSVIQYPHTLAASFSPALHWSPSLHGSSPI